ncbi:chorismate-binding protein [Croceivirga thetidis]|uniref:Chorismate-binding protein n=1 Tax=Croceivirga thetidis TaxID=2721623 RepID=A0ABX1GT72_9FLAO|nr:chorismate-binding protein [Croceivirga thetidis]NKI32100.1 chorismate-binding protein [Croceivirga thetidis]
MPSQKKDSSEQKISRHLDARLPMVMYRLPLETKVNCVFQSNSKLNFLDRYNQKGFIFAPFDTDKKEIVLFKADETLEYHFDSLEVLDNGKSFSKKEDLDFHLRLIEKSIERIRDGSLKKVIASRSINVTCDISAVVLFKRLLQNYPTAFCYLLYHPKVGTWLGASPELLVSVKGLEFKTTSLAGTLPVNGSYLPKWTSKELQEQQLVTDFIQDELQHLALPLKISKVENYKAGKLWHLKSVLTGKLNSFEQLKKVIEALHPTPAVCGLPKRNAKEFILANENYDRDFYTGFLGELNMSESNSANIFVNLRCMKLEEGLAKIFVGGGITIDSVPQNELQETIAKSSTMLDLL